MIYLRIWNLPHKTANVHIRVVFKNLSFPAQNRKYYILTYYLLTYNVQMYHNFHLLYCSYSQCIFTILIPRKMHLQGNKVRHIIKYAWALVDRASCPTTGSLQPLKLYAQIKNKTKFSSYIGNSQLSGAKSYMTNRLLIYG